RWCARLRRRPTGRRSRRRVPANIPAAVGGGCVVGGVGRGLGLLTEFGAGFRTRDGGILGHLHPDHRRRSRTRSGSRPTRGRTRPGSPRSSCPASASPGFGSALGCGGVRGTRLRRLLPTTTVAVAPAAVEDLLGVARLTFR